MKNVTRIPTNYIEFDQFHKIVQKIIIVADIDDAIAVGDTEREVKGLSELI